MASTKKRCTCCKRTQSSANFYKNSHRKDGLSTVCKTCQDQYSRSWLARNRDKKRSRDRISKIRKRYGLARDQYEALLKKYPSCPICGQAFTTKNKPFVDHNHANSEVRALLCNNCNTLIGRARDDVAILKSAIKYLRRFS